MDVVLDFTNITSDNIYSIQNKIEKILKFSEKSSFLLLFKELDLKIYVLRKESGSSEYGIFLKKKDGSLITKSEFGSLYEIDFIANTFSDYGSSIKTIKNEDILLIICQDIFKIFKLTENMVFQ